MPPKRKSNTHNNQSVSGAAESQTTTGDAIPRGKWLRADQLFDDADPASLVTSMSINIEHTQTEHQPQPSTRSLNIATQGQAVNPMAPSHCSDEEEASQTPPWAVSSKPLTQVQPSFMVSQSGQQFGFKLPSQSNTAQSTRHSTQADMGSILQDHAALARRTTIGLSAYQLAPLRQSLQLQTLAAAANQSSEVPVRNSRVHHSLGPITNLSSTPLVRDQHPSDEHPHSPPPWPAGLHRTQSFHQLPSFLPSSHSMFATNVDRNGSSVIDEASPSDDDRFAESVLHGQGFPASEQQNPDAHTKRDPGNDATEHTGQPEVECVQSIPTQSQHNHVPGLTTAQTLIQSPAQQSTSATDIDPPSVTHPVVAIASGTSGTIPDNNDPSQLQFYALSIHDIIEHAKQFLHCDITSANPFPLRPDFNNKAVEYMNEAITECHSRGLLIPDGWWPQHMPDITRLISVDLMLGRKRRLLWEDIGNWRSSLKKKAHSHVRESYEWDPQNCCTVNADIAKKLLDRGFFLKHGMDKEGHMNNLAHPSLSGLIIDFFYTGPNSMGNLFPEVFENEIKLALDEVAAKGKEVTFKRDIYTDVYVDIISLMTKCDTAPVHHAKTKALRVQWAKIGSLSKGLNFDSTGMTWGVLDRACQLGTLLEWLGICDDWLALSRAIQVLEHPGALCNSLSKGLNFDSTGMTWGVLDRACQLGTLLEWLGICDDWLALSRAIQGKAGLLMFHTMLTTLDMSTSH
ncbi:hypothetical protein BDN67DRAFT_984450 [Paxillus ammoniavirescens]|nr:hypothetical protein BDN67DRAFT_984450 [Paxillus ammoniavirescens]